LVCYPGSRDLSRVAHEACAHTSIYENVSEFNERRWRFSDGAERKRTTRASRNARRMRWRRGAPTDRRKNGHVVALPINNDFGRSPTDSIDPRRQPIQSLVIDDRQQRVLSLAQLPPSRLGTEIGQKRYLASGDHFERHEYAPVGEKGERGLRIASTVLSEALYSIGRQADAACSLQIEHDPLAIDRVAKT
jgi:hypothetical protein